MLALAAESGTVLGMIALIFGVGIGVQVLAARLRLPPLVLLLAAGIVLGPVTGVLVPGTLLGDAATPLISAGVALVLFEGGLTLRFREAKLAGPVLFRLILSGLVLGFALTTAAGIVLVGLDPATAATLGAILVVTGPTVILPMLRQARIAMRPATLLKWEGIVNDPLGALLAVFVLQVASAAPAVDTGVLRLLPELLLRATLGAALGTAAAILFGSALRRCLVPDHLRSPLLLAAALVVHALAEHIGEENGLLAVTVMGLVLANHQPPRLDDVHHFKEQVSVLLVSVLFVVLSARLRLADVEALLGWPLVLVAVVIFVIRPLVVLAATLRSGLPWTERLLLSHVCPRGVVAAAVAGAFTIRLVDVGHSDARLLVPIVFGVIVATVVLQGFTIGLVARRLGLSTVDGTGVLIVGASHWVTALASALERAGAQVVVSDTRFQRVSRARRDGLDAWYGDVLSEEIDLELPLERISWVLAATDDDHYNALVCVHFAREFGHERVLQLTPHDGDGREHRGHAMLGRTPWGERGTYRALAGAYWLHQQVRVTRLSPEFPYAKLRADHPRGVALFQVVDGRVTPLDADSEPPAGARIVHFAELPPWASAAPADDDDDDDASGDA